MALRTTVLETKLNIYDTDSVGKSESTKRLVLFFSWDLLRIRKIQSNTKCLLFKGF